MRNKILLLAVGGLLFNLFAPNGVLAADPDFLYLDGNLGQTGMSTELRHLYNAVRKAVVAVSVIMTALGGFMIALELDTARKTLWNVFLSMGLILGIAHALANTFDPSSSGLFLSGAHSVDLNSIKFNDGSNEWYDILTPFGNIWMDVCGAGAEHLAMNATKLLLILTVINVTVKIAMDTLQGDKIKYLVEMVLQTGFYTFLIAFWFRYPGSGSLSLMGLLVEFFEAIGYAATDGTALMTNSGETIDMRSTAGASVVQQAIGFFMKAYKASDLSITSPITSLVVIVILGAILVLLLKGGLELFMAKIEFFTLAMVTVPLLPFVALPQTKFLFEKSIGAMFNLAVKVCVCAFLSGIAAVILGKFVEEFTISNDITTNMPLLIQALLVSLLLYFLIQKIPALTQSLLSGSPSLDGASMSKMAGGAANTAAKVGGAVASGGTSIAVNTAKGAAFGAAAGAGKAAAAGSGSASQFGAGLAGGLAGGANAFGGSLASGVSGLAKNAIFGSNNNNRSGGTSGYAAGNDNPGGGVLSKADIVNAFRQGTRLGDQFNAKENPDDPTSKPLNLVATKDNPNSVAKQARHSFIEAWDRPVMVPERDADGNIVKNKDGTPHMVDSGRHQGLYGSWKQFKEDTREAYKPKPPKK